MSQLDREVTALKRELEKEYAEFEKWCDEHATDLWKPFTEWVTLKYAAMNDNLSAEEEAVMRQIHASELFFPV